MGYAGQPMKVIKANRALLQKRNTFKKVKDMFVDATHVTELAFKEVSPRELARIKTEIRRKAKKAAQVRMGLLVLCLTVVTLFFYWLFYV